MPLIRFPGKTPLTLGPHEGQLAPCGDRPNCVCSQFGGDAPADVSPHYIRPLLFDGDPYDAMTRLIAVLLNLPSAHIVTQTRDYVHVEFERLVFGCIGLLDDAEFLLDSQARVIHVRAAARLGYSDLGINRARIEELRVAFDEADDATESSIPED
jgi:uncharacterized protein (DUF1499 family)